jgi:hypothetical protein
MANKEIIGSDHKKMLATKGLQANDKTCTACLQEVYNMVYYAVYMRVIDTPPDFGLLVF